MAFPPQLTETRKRTITWVLVLLAVGIIGWLLYRVIDREILGFIHDDGVYAVTAQALAQGKGFTLLHVVGQFPQVKYPIVYPLILSPAWLLNPSFPDNLLLMSAITLAFSLGSLVLFFYYLWRVHQFPAWVAWTAIPLVAGNFYNMYFFSAVMSEGPYLFFSLLTLLAAEKLYAGRPTLKNLGWVLLFSVLTFHTRVLGLALVAAVGMWLLARRQYRHALLYGVSAVLLTITPWMLWVKLNSPAKITDINYPLMHVYSNYTMEFQNNFQRLDVYLKGLRGSFSLLVSHLLEALFPVIPNFYKVFPSLKPLRENLNVAVVSLMTVLICTYALIGYYIGQAVQVTRVILQKKDPASLSLSALYLVFYLLVVVIWNYEDQIYRFLVVISPFLWLFFLKPLVHLLASSQSFKRRAAAMAVVATAIVSLIATPGSYYIIDTSRREHWVESGQALWLWDDYKRTFAFIRQHIPQDVPIAASSDVVFYLYTGHPTYYVNMSSLRVAGGRFLVESADNLLPSMAYYGVQYLVVEPHLRTRVIHGPRNAVSDYLLRHFPERFEPVYTSPRRAFSIYRILPEPGKRQES